ncbi:MAG TPA: hypothetical protein QGI72_02185, partial [Poseidonia sp.]|nr:hypothetical protein [Poseidonia sp.]
TKSIKISFDAPESEETFSRTEIIAGSLGGIIFLVVLLLFMRRTPKDYEMSLELEEKVQAISGPPTSGPPASSSVTHQQNPDEQPKTESPEAPSSTQTSGPPIPETGLPAGWTEEQWSYYGQQYLDGTL